MKTNLRKWTFDDVHNLVKYGNNPNIVKNLTDRFPHPYTEDNAHDFITMTLHLNPQCIFKIHNDEFGAIGSIGLHPQDDIFKLNAELGYFLGEPFWGKGIITTSIQQIVAYGFENLNINRIFARPFGSNIASQKVLLKSGFKLDYILEKTLIKNNVLEDEHCYSIRRN